MVAGAGAGAGGSATMSSAGSAGAPPATRDCSAPRAPVLHARLLSPSQYENSVEDWLKVSEHPAREFGGGIAARLDEVEVERRATLPRNRQQGCQ